MAANHSWTRKVRIRMLLEQVHQYINPPSQKSKSSVQKCHLRTLKPKLVSTTENSDIFKHNDSIGNQIYILNGIGQIYSTK